MKTKYDYIKNIQEDYFSFAMILHIELSKYLNKISDNETYNSIIDDIIELVTIFYPKLDKILLYDNIKFNKTTIVFGEFSYLMNDKYSKYKIISELRKQKFKILIEE